MSFMSHNLTIYRPTVTGDEIGGKVKSYALIATVKGRFSGGSSSASDAYGTENTQTQNASAMLPINCGIALYDAIYYDSNYYEVQTITNRAGHHIEVGLLRINPDIAR